MTTFNLIDEPWIPCASGGPAVELGLRDVLRGAHEIDSIVGLSPPTTVALHRLLLAIVQRVYRPVDDGSWECLWNAGSFGDEIDRYLDIWRHRFDLFDPARPFYQVAELPFEPYEHPAVLLTLEWGSGNPEHFSHAPDEYPFTPAEAARHLLTYQAFDPGGTKTHEKGKQPDKYTAAAPLNRGAVAVVQGDNLFETLLLNTIDYDPDRGEPNLTTPDDAPAWEQDQPVRPDGKVPLGYLDWLTWQARRVRLHPVEENGWTVVRRAIAMKGFFLPDDVYAQEYETMVAYRAAKNAKPGESPYLPIGFDQDRALWRDSLVLFESAGGLQPKTLHQLGDRPRNGSVIRPLTLSGIAGNKSMVTLWREESLPLPLVYFYDTDLLQLLADAVKLSDAVGGAVRFAADVLATWLVAPDRDQPGARQPARAVVTALRGELGVEERFWPRLERPFINYLIHQAEAGYDLDVLRDWARVVRRAAYDALATTIDALDPDARSIRAGVEATAVLDHGLHSVWKQFPVARLEKEISHEYAHG